MGKFIIKHIDNRKPQIKIFPKNVTNNEDVQKPNIDIKEKNNNTKNKEVMTTNEKVAMVQELLDAPKTNSFKRVKKDKGLIERAESSKIILTEDNKELLND